MADQRDFEHIEQSLRTGASLVDWPPTARQLAPRVVATLDQPVARRRPSPRWALAAAIVLVLSAVMLLSPRARQAVADLFEIAGIRFGVTSEEPTSGSVLDLGEAVDLADLGDLAGFVPRRPSALGDPDEAFFDDSGIVWMVWKGADSLPAADDSGVSWLLGQFVDDGRIVGLKTLGPGVEAIDVSVGGRLGFWITGNPHAFTYIDSGNELKEDSTRLAANVLLWSEAGINYRLETTDDDFTRALEIAESLDP